ncbi:MAG TPA: SGNH/GDSL hydrolase family protein [Longimicrobiales bacterium]|nr:SGNH/GDSL hydrolase family protein [Longimicrobiales bacterium]
MAARKKTQKQNLTAAIASGRSAAREVVQFRAKQRRKRSTAARATRPARRRAAAAPARIPRKTRSTLGPAADAGVLIAEGDSWFDYPLWDVLRILEDEFLYDVESVAHKGDCVEDMAHSKGQFEEFARRLEKLLRQNKVPRAILLSGGGNDIAGDELPILINYAASGLPTLNEDIVRGVIDVRLRAAYGRMIGGITAIAQSYLQRPIPIIMHGYDYPVPDGRGFLGGWWKLPGPWLRPGFVRKGHEDKDANQRTIAKLIDRFNDMLEGVSNSAGFAHVHYLDLRGTLPHDSQYKKYWGNELHPSERGFGMVTQKFAKLIEQV